MLANILMTFGLILIMAGLVGLVVTTVEKVKLNDNSVQNQMNTIFCGFVFFAGTLVAAGGAALLM